MTADQTIYAFAKQINWKWPAQYGEEHFVIMFGALHIEMTALRSLGCKTADGQELSPKQELLCLEQQIPYYQLLVSPRLAWPSK